MSSASESRSEVVLALAEEFLERYRRGERPSLQEYIDRHPELAADIREVFPAMAMMEKIALADDSLDDAGRSPEEQQPPLPLEQLGDYRVIREVGRGGMGIVYEAEQVSLGRHVALKVLPQKMLLDPKYKRRFEREAKAAAGLHHTNIVPVFGVGEQDGLPYYVMQFIQGQPLDEVLRELKRLQAGGGAPSPAPAADQPEAGRELSAARVARSLLSGQFDGTVDYQEAPGPAAPVSAAPAAGASDSFTLSGSSAVLPGASGAGRHSGSGRRPTYWQSVAQLGVQVAEALEYAHKQGVLHRDIKPSNLLLDLRGTVWVTDFGLAKAGDQPDLTGTGDVLGTLRYMAPEAFDGKADERSEVYSLGLTLYELLALRPAFEEKDRHKLIRQVTTAEPPRLNRLNRAVPRDLVTIVHKAIDHDPRRRYASAGELAADLQRFLTDEPIRARRVGVVERCGRWCRRNPVIATLTAVVLLVTLAGFAATYWQWQETLTNEAEAKENAGKYAAERDEARKARDTLRHTVYGARLNLIPVAWEANNLERVRELLKLTRPAEEEPDLRGFEWYYWQRQCHLEVRSLYAPALDGSQLYTPVPLFSPDATRLVLFPHVAPSEGVVEVWDTTGATKPLTLPKPPSHYLGAAAFSPDGKRLMLVWISEAPRKRVAEVRVWDLSRGRELLRRTMVELSAQLCTGTAIFSQDGTRVAVALSQSSSVVKVWDVSTGQELRSLTLPGAVTALALHHNGTHLGAVVALGGEKGQPRSRELRTWNVASGQETLSLVLSRDRPEGPVEFSPDGHSLAYWVRVLAPKGPQLQAMELRVLDVFSGQVRLTLAAGSNGGMSTNSGALVFSPDGRHLAAALRIPPAGPPAMGDDVVKVWEVATGNELGVLRSPHISRATHLLFSPDGKFLAAFRMFDLTIGLWDIAAGRWARNLKGHTDPVRAVAFGPDSRRLVSAGDDGTVRTWDVTPPATSPTVPGLTCLAICPEGPHGVLGDFGNVTSTLKLVSPGRQEPLALAVPPGKPVPNGALFSTDGKRVAVLWEHTAGKDKTGEQQVEELRVWDTATGRLLGTLAAGKQSSFLTPVVFSPDGRRLAALVGFQVRAEKIARAVKVWDVDTGQVLLNAGWDTAWAPTGLTFSPDGRRIAVSYQSWDRKRERARDTGGIKVWNLAGSQVLLNVDQVPGAVLGRPIFSPDGHYLAFGLDSVVEPPGEIKHPATMHVWDMTTGRKVLTLRREVFTFLPLAFSPDGRRLATGGDSARSNEIHLWDMATGAELAVLRGHSGSIECLAFHPDGRRLASLTLFREFQEIKEVKVWNVDTGQELLSLTGSGGAYDGPFQLAFSRDGYRLTAVWGVAEPPEEAIQTWDATPLPEDSEPKDRQ